MSFQYDVKKVQRSLYVDVDGTLLLWTPKPGRVPRHGEVGYGIPPVVCLRTVDLIRRAKERSEYVVLWSMGGVEHARWAAEFAQINDLVDACMPKPITMIDDNYGFLERAERLSP